MGQTAQRLRRRPKRKPFATPATAPQDAANAVPTTLLATADEVIE
jgi:hypothetical protein